MESYELPAHGGVFGVNALMAELVTFCIYCAWSINRF